MAQEILNNILNLKIQPVEVINWLTNNDLSTIQQTNFDEICPKEEFVSHFSNYLKDQFTSVLQIPHVIKQTPAKILPQLANNEINKSKSISSNNNPNPVSSCDNVVEELADRQQKPAAESQPISYNSLSELDNSKSTKVLPTGNQVTELSKIIEQSNINSISPTASPQTSTPVNKKRNSSHKKRAKLIACSPLSRNINPAFKNSIEYDPSSNTGDSRNISFDDTSFPSLGGRDSNSMNGTNCSPSMNRSGFSDSMHSNLSQKSCVSASNRILQSPVSPLYSSSVPTMSPLNIKSHGRHNESSDSYKQQFIETPTKSPNYSSNNSKTTPRHNFSLGDFIITESHTKKKGSGKKKVTIKNEDQQKGVDQQNSISDTSNCSEQNARRRKVNPTRINVTDEKAKQENAVFGDVSRPFTQNPQFVNVSPIDKSVDNASFQVERGLVKIERQKKPENNQNNNSTNDDQTPSKWKILQRTPSKVISKTSIIIPNKDLVENMEILNVLAELYSGFLDYNLVFNPMTELYFIINLITNQYKDGLKQLLSITKKLNEKKENNTETEKKNLSALRKSLNFDNFPTEQDSVESNDKNFYTDKLDELGCSNLIHETKDNLNLINENFKGLSTNHSEKCVNELITTDNCNKLFLNTPHNCVYFSTKVLDYQKNFLKHLDRVTLKLLCENVQISTFQPELNKFLESIYSMKVSESNKIKPSLNAGAADMNVCFQIDTDNREKFPSSIAFQCFRKQRDMFYEILKIWEDKHLVPGWTFQIALVGKIKTLLSMHMDVTNFTHFTRLFKSQMLISCIQSGQQEESLDDETLDFLKNLKDIDPEKLTKLQRKLVTPLSQNGPVPLPSFPGVQEFYKNFIVHAGHPMFYTYLENTFVYEIMELSDTQFIGSDIEESETEVDECTKHNFVTCQSSLRVLAKFLGFLTSLPYRSETSALEEVITSQVTLRSKCLPRIDLQYCLQSALVEGKLSLIVPWVVEFLSMMDHASLKLPYYKSVLEMLYCIYRTSSYHAVTTSDELMSQKTAVLLKFSIGWLFELPIFPREFYYLLQSKYCDKELKMISEEQHQICKLETSKVSVKRSVFLDRLEMIDDRILYSCCPFLRELNILLTSGNSSVNNSAPYRHVTPVTSQLQKPVKKTNNKHLEIQLEEAFFHGQSMSTRKTVEYVSERVASSCVKYIYNNLLIAERKRNSEVLKRIVDENYSEILEKNPEQVKNFVMKDMNSISAEASKRIKEKSDQVIPKICVSRVTQSMEALLAEDCLKPVKDMCAKIAIRMAMERIDQWIQSHIVGGSFFMKDMELELSRAFKSNDEVVIDKKCHNPSAASPTDFIDNIRMVIWDILETRGLNITYDSISQLCDQLYQCLTERSDLKLLTEKIIISSSIDLCLFLISYREDLFTVDIQKKIFKVWKLKHLNLSEADSSIHRIICQRNVMLLAQSSYKNVWLNCGKFLNNLLKNDILSIDSLSDQAVALFRNEWPIELLKNLSICLKEAINGFRSSDEETERIRYLLDWVAGAFNEMDRDGFDISFN